MRTSALGETWNFQDTHPLATEQHMEQFCSRVLAFCSRYDLDGRSTPPEGMKAIQVNGAPTQVEAAKGLITAMLDKHGGQA